MRLESRVPLTMPVLIKAKMKITGKASGTHANISSCDNAQLFQTLG